MFSLLRLQARYLSNKREYSTYVTKSPDSQTYGGHVEGVGDEVHHVPEVAGVLLQPHVPQLLDLAPDEASHPGEDAELHWGGEGASLVKQKYSQYYSPAERFVCLDLDCLLSGLTIIQIENQAGDRETCLGGVGVQVPAHDILYPLRCEDQQNCTY